jgi:hypothetical protein
VKTVLEKPERTEPAADKSPSDNPDEAENPDCHERKNPQSGKIDQDAYGAGKNRGGARVAVQGWNAYRTEAEEVSVEE